VCLSKAFKNLNAHKKCIFKIIEKPRVVFAKCIWIRGNFKISEGWFCKHTFSYFIPCKNYIFIQKVAIEMHVLKCIKIWVKL
jgi:hypothetical protein